MEVQFVSILTKILLVLVVIVLCILMFANSLPFFSFTSFLFCLRNFDASLKARDSSWGVRDLESVVALAEENGLELDEKIEMPANNLSLIFRKMRGNMK